MTGREERGKGRRGCGGGGGGGQGKGGFVCVGRDLIGEWVGEEVFRGEEVALLKPRKS